MNKYYLIPTTESDIYFNDKSLGNILEEYYPELFRREEERIDILYSTSPLISMPASERRRYNEHNAETKKMFDKKQVPQYLIAYGNDYYAEEILTKIKITSKYPAALSIRSVSKEKVEEYYYSSNYKTKITNYFSNIKIISEIPFNDTYDFVGYVDGKIDGHSVTGSFKGKIKAKKLINL